MESVDQLDLKYKVLPSLIAIAGVGASGKKMAPISSAIVERFLSDQLLDIGSEKTRHFDQWPETWAISVELTGLWAQICAGFRQ